MFTKACACALCSDKTTETTLTLEMYIFVLAFDCAVEKHAKTNVANVMLVLREIFLFISFH